MEIWRLTTCGNGLQRSIVTFKRDTFRPSCHLTNLEGSLRNVVPWFQFSLTHVHYSIVPKSTRDSVRQEISWYQGELHRVPLRAVVYRDSRRDITYSLEHPYRST